VVDVSVLRSLAVQSFQTSYQAFGATLKAVKKGDVFPVAFTLKVSYPVVDSEKKILLGEVVLSIPHSLDELPLLFAHSGFATHNKFPFEASRATQTRTTAMGHTGHVGRMRETTASTRAITTSKVKTFIVFGVANSAQSYF
jgi:hypothetical protein